MAILSNRAQCKHCLEVLVSTHDHDFKSCSCGNLSVDGGDTHLSRSCRDPNGFIELSVCEPERPKGLKKDGASTIDDNHCRDRSFHRDEATIQTLLEEYPALTETYIRAAFAARTGPITSQKDKHRIIEAYAAQLNEQHAQCTESTERANATQNQSTTDLGVSPLAGLAVTPGMEAILDRHIHGEIELKTARVELGCWQYHLFEITVALPSDSEATLKEALMKLTQTCDDALCGIGVPGRIGLMFERAAPNREAAIQSAKADIDAALNRPSIIAIRAK